MDVPRVKERQNWFDNFVSLMDQNIRGVQYGVYAVAGVGFLVAMKSVRPFLKFKSPSSIPKHFVKKNMTFNGKVVSIQPGAKVGDNPLIMVDHTPLIKLPFSQSEGSLPVQISGVDIQSNGFLWMHSLLLENHIRFTPLRTDAAVVHALVYDNKRQNVGNHLATIGFATVAPFDTLLDNNLLYKKYYKSLLDAENKAEKRGVGIWQEGKASLMASTLSKLKILRRFSPF